MRSKRTNIIVLIAFILLIGLSVYYIVTAPINLGLDLKGGTQIILKPYVNEESEITNQDLNIAMDIIRDRIDYLGVSEPLITRDTLNNNIVIQLPGVNTSERALEIIGKTAQLEFRVLLGHFLPLKEYNQIGIVDFDPETGNISYSNEADKISLLKDDRATGIQTEEGVLYKETNTGDFYLMDKDFNNKSLEYNSEVPIQQAFNDNIIGKFNYNEATHEIYLVNIDNNETLGELLIDSRSGTASLVGPVLITGDKLADSSVEYGNTGEVIVLLSFKEEGIIPFKEVTENNLGEQLAIVLDEEIKSAPYLNHIIEDGEAVIEGIRNTEEANEISKILNIGALPFNLIREDVSIIGPELGEDALNAGLYAGIIGILLIIIFMIIYYRGLGAISILGLIIYTSLFWGIISGIGAALTLPGIAGIILTIGMAVDANVIIFARIREEARKGKSTRVAIGDGYKHALRTIVDANVTTLITAGALYFFGTGPIKGFALTLALGVGISMAISLLFTRSVLFLIAGSYRIAPSFVGVRKKEEK